MKRVIYTKNAPEAIGPYSQAIEINDTLYISGQLAIDSKTGKLIEGNIEEQTELILKNIGIILAAAGYSYSDVVKCTCLLSDFTNFQAMNRIYGKYYPENSPARAAYEVSKLPLGALIEIETIAAK